MKNLKVKSILFSLVAMMAVAVFMTSCEQEHEIIGGDIESFMVAEDELTNLSQKLQDDTDFQSLVKISEEVLDELVSLKTEGNYRTYTVLMNSDNFVNPYYQYMEAMENHDRNIRLKYPEINTLSKVDIENIYKQSIENTISSRSGRCIWRCYNDLLSANEENGLLAQNQHNTCVENGGDPETCADAAIEWLIEQNDINEESYNDCIDDCSPNCCPIEVVDR